MLGTLLAVGALAATASTSRPGSVFKQLERPVVNGALSVGPGPVKTLVRTQPYRVTLGLTPNRASVHSRLSVKFTDAGRSLRGASVTATFSMPVMNMWGVLTTRLEPVGNGTYATSLPVLGMAGPWQLRLRVAAPGGRPISLTVNDRMGT
jgi:hypothetical protein